MIQIESKLSELSTIIEKELNSVDQELLRMPEGQLKCEKQHGCLKFVCQQYVNNVRRRKNLEIDDQELLDLIKRDILGAEQTHLRTTLNVLKKVELSVKDFDLNNEVNNIKRRLPLITEELVLKALMLHQEDNWASKQYERFNYQDEKTKWQMSSFGMKFRSKSELLIAEMLRKYDIPFHYEEVLHFGDTTIVPDFTIRRSDEKIFYWEHEGLTNSQNYINRQMKKHQIYAMNNIVPWDNFIVTYDNADGIIDLRIIESEIRNKLL